MKKFFSYIVKIIFLGFFFCVFYFGYIWKQRSDDLWKNGIITQATIVDYKVDDFADIEGGVSRTYTPILKFTTEDGKTIIKPSNISKSKDEILRMQAANETIEIVYKKGNPSRLSVNSDGYKNAGIWIMLIGILGICFGLWRIIRKITPSRKVI